MAVGSCRVYFVKRIWGFDVRWIDITDGTCILPLVERLQPCGLGLVKLPGYHVFRNLEGYPLKLGIYWDQEVPILPAGCLGALAISCYPLIQSLAIK